MSLRLEQRAPPNTPCIACSAAALRPPRPGSTIKRNVEFRFDPCHAFHGDLDGAAHGSARAGNEALESATVNLSRFSPARTRSSHLRSSQERRFSDRDLAADFDNLIAR